MAALEVVVAQGLIEITLDLLRGDVPCLPALDAEALIKQGAGSCALGKAGVYGS